LLEYVVVERFYPVSADRGRLVRPHRPADPSPGPVEALAHALNELREDRTFESMSRYLTRGGTPVAIATLSAAARGQRLPMWQTVEAFVRACGQDPAAWRDRWDQ
jgi:hypothetical protein